MKNNKLLWGVVIFNIVSTVVLAFLASLVFIAAFVMPTNDGGTSEYVDEQMKANREYIDKVVADDQKYINEEMKKLYDYVNSR